MKSRVPINLKKTSENKKFVSEESIQKRAHELYLRRGREAGHELEDWLQAERELSANRQEHGVN